MSLAPGTRLGPYEILSPLGAGGMGEVYKAKDTRLDRLVAIKVLSGELASDPHFRQRFDREARAISSLNHPHICTLHDVGHQDGVDFLVMEFLDGESLADRLKKGPLPVGQAMTYAMEIADALDKAHQHGIVHRDLKPGNVILTPAGAKLLDFGLAKMDAARGLGATETRLQTSPASAGNPLTAEGAILGTFQYMAPEQIEGLEADARTDIWAFGCVLYEMVTGRRAFEGKTQASLIGAILEREPAPLSAVQSLAPPALNHVVRRCLAKLREDRWQAVADIRHELAWIAERGAESEPMTPGAGATAKAQRRERLAWSVAALALLAALTVTAIGVITARREAPRPLMRFTVGLPDSVGTPAYLAVSPDGRRLAFLGSNPGGSGTALWVRTTDALDARALVGTEGPGLNHPHPFWSPDGQSIGFFSGGKLNRIDVASGVVQIICDAAGGRGGAWNHDGTIIFAPDAFSPLYRVAASSGSAPAPLTTLGTSLAEQSHRMPSFLPDGRHFVFTVFAANGRTSIRVGSLDSAATSELVASPASDVNLGANTSQAYVSGGRLLFVRGSALLAQPLDQNNWRLTGEPTPIVARVDQDDNGRMAFAVSDDGLLVYRPPAAPAVQQLTWFTRAGTRQTAVWKPGQLAEFSLSPDGRRAAVSRSDPQTDLADIWVVDLDRGAASQLTHDRDSQSPLWSPDGTRIIFGAARGYGADDLYSRPADGSGPEQLLLDSPPARKIPVGWLQDGGLVLAVGNPQGRLDLWTLPATGDRRLTLSMKNDGEASFLFAGADVSRDGRWMAYASAGEVYVQPFPNGPRVQITTGGGCCPSWRRDGNELYYVSRGKLMAADVRRGATIAVSAAKHLFDLPPDFGSYGPSPDGQRFLITVATGAAAAPAPLTVILNCMSSVH